MADFDQLPESLFEQLLDLLDGSTDPERVERAVRGLCAENPLHADALHAALLAARDSTPAGAGAVAPRAPERIGPYRILELLGRGGMGEVYRAERREPVRQQVAIKLVKQGLASREVLARFEFERRALAAMSHRSIARVFDVGSTSTGEPYFVMELVEGLPINVYCDRHRLAMHDRLGLFKEVCHAVHHAHQKGIVHRDLKPGNVLVVREGDKALPKVLDFGLAKATNRQFLDATVLTERGRVMGTPQYMAPEQAAGDGDLIDVRADVYSLGVMLYELLAGTLPFTIDELRRVGELEALRIIREVDPPRPSMRLASGLAAAGEVAGLRGLSASRLTRELRGDLDWIVLKALEKEPERRYEAAISLAADIRRYLSHEPVDAGPPSTVYRLAKLVRKYRGQVVAAAAVVITALVGAVFALRYAAEAGAAAVEASRQEGIAKAKAAEAEARASELEQVAEFQGVRLRRVNPRAMGELLRLSILAAAQSSMELAQMERDEVSVRTSRLATLLEQVNFTDLARGALHAEILGPAIEAVDDGFADRPLVRARLLQSVASTMREFGLRREALGPQQRALALYQEHAGPVHEDALSSLNSLGLLHDELREFEAAERCYREAIDGYRGIRSADDVDLLTCIGNLGSVLTAQQRYEDAEPLVREALEGRMHVLGEGSRATLVSINGLGVVLERMGRPQEAESFYRRALDGFRRLCGHDDPMTLAAMNNLAEVLAARGRIDEARQLRQGALEGMRHALGDDHPTTLITLDNLADLHVRTGELEQAERCFRELAERRSRVLGRNEEKSRLALQDLAEVLEQRGELDAASEVWEDLLERSIAASGEYHEDAVAVLGNLGFLRLAQQNPQDAERYFRRSLEAARRGPGDEDPATLTAVNNVGYFLRSQRRFAEAEPFFLEALAGRRRVLGEDHTDTMTSLSNLGALRFSQGRFAEAEQFFYDAVQGRIRGQGMGHAATSKSREILGKLLLAYGERLLAAGELGQAESKLLEAHEILADVGGPGSDLAVRVVEGLVALYERRTQGDDTDKAARAAESWRAKLPAGQAGR